MSDVNIYTKSLDGHRGAYLYFAQKTFGGKRGWILNILISKSPALFLMIEESFFLYVSIALIRSIFGCRTVGLLFRPLPALNGTELRLITKRKILKLLRRINNIKTISLVPFPLEDGIKTIADDWIYDFQLWDLTESEHETYSRAKRSGFTAEQDSLVKTINSEKKGRKVLAAIGVQDKN